MLSSSAYGAAVDWYFDFVGGDDFEVKLAVYGTDHRGLAAYNIELSGLDSLGIDPNSVSWSENTELGDSPLTQASSQGLSFVNSQVEATRPVFGISQSTVGTLTIPGVSEVGIGPESFLGTTATLFSREAPSTPNTATRTLPSNRVSSSIRGGFVSGDVALRSIPQDGIISFGEVQIGTTSFEDIVALINGEFGGPEVEISGFRISGRDASLFDVPDFRPWTLRGMGSAITYDVSFAPEQMGSYRAALSFQASSTFGGSEGVQYSLIGIAVPEPCGSCLAFMAMGILVARRKRSHLLPFGHAASGAPS